MSAGDRPTFPRLLVVDDHAAVREGIALLAASEGMGLVAGVASGGEALAALPARRPDLAIVDLSLEDEDGLALVAELARRGVPALVYSMHGDAQHVEAALAAGASGYVTKAERGAVLIAAIRVVAAGGRFVSPEAGLALGEAGAAPL